MLSGMLFRLTGVQTFTAISLDNPVESVLANGNTVTLQIITKSAVYILP